MTNEWNGAYLWWEEAAPWKIFDILNTGLISINGRVLAYGSKEGGGGGKNLAETSREMGETAVELVGMKMSGIYHGRISLTFRRLDAPVFLSVWTNERTNERNK